MSASQPPPPAAKPLACIFSRTLEGKHAVCEFAATRHGLPGRRTLCTQALARAGCGELSALLIEHSRFALNSAKTSLSAPTSVRALRQRAHGGGLEALRQVLSPASSSPNVHELIQAAYASYGTLAKLPFSELVRVIRVWRQA